MDVPKSSAINECLLRKTKGEIKKMNKENKKNTEKEYQAHQIEEDESVEGSSNESSETNEQGPVSDLTRNKVLLHKIKKPSSKISDSKQIVNVPMWPLIVIPILGFLVYLYLSPSDMETQIQIDVAKLVKSVKQEFGNQPKITYKILYSALKSVVDPEPPAPAIITLLADKGAENTAVKFSKFVAQSIAPDNFVTIDKSIYGIGNEDYIKEKIDEVIQSKVDGSKLNAVVVENLEHIPLNATMIFHSYCDHENASFKNVVYMFILTLKDILPDNEISKNVDDAADKHLRQVWHSISSDVIDSLISRLIVNVINIKPVFV